MPSLQRPPKTAQTPRRIGAPRFEPGDIVWFQPLARGRKKPPPARRLVEILTAHDATLVTQPWYDVRDEKGAVSIAGEDQLAPSDEPLAEEGK